MLCLEQTCFSPGVVFSVLSSVLIVQDMPLCSAVLYSDTSSRSCFLCCTQVCVWELSGCWWGLNIKRYFRELSSHYFLISSRKKKKENTRYYLTCLQLSWRSDSDHLAWSQIMSLMVTLRAGNLRLGFQFQDCKVWIIFCCYMNQDFLASEEINSV